MTVESASNRWQRARYRVGQFLRGWHATVSAADRRLVADELPPAAAALFAHMPADAQAHSLRVARTLQASGATPHDLMVAALLHDVGKVAASDAGAYLGLWMRGPVVLLEAFTPALLRRLAAPEPSASPRYAIYVQLMHPQIGAAWAQAAGCSDLTCWLIEHHQDKLPANTGANLVADAGASALLARLQWADGRN